MELETWYEKGLKPESFIQSLDKHKGGFEGIYKHFQLPDETDFFEELTEKKLRAIIIAEVWCGHCMLNIPIFLKIARKANIPVRILPRDENLKLMDRYLTHGNRTIPIFIFIDEAGNEVATWGPVAESTKQFVDEYRKELPAKDATGYDEKFKAFITIISKSFQDDSNLWHGVYDSMKQTLLKA